MKWNSIVEKLRQKNLLKSVFKNPIMVVIAVIGIAISLVNFSSKDSVECPAILTYDEISEAITLNYCQLDHARYQIEAVDKTDVIRADQLQFTVGGEIITVSWEEAQIIVSSLPDYVFINLIFTDACYQNNSTDVSFPIDPAILLSCDGNQEIYLNESDDFITENERVEHSEEVVDESPTPTIVKEIIIQKDTPAKVKKESQRDSQVPKSDTQVKLEVNTISKAKIADKDADGLTGTEKQQLNRISEKKKSVEPVLVVNHEKKEPKVQADVKPVIKVEPVISTPSDKSINRNVTVDSRPTKVESNNHPVRSSTDNVSIVSATTSKEKLMPATVVVEEPVTPSIRRSGISLFNTKEIGVEKSCIASSNRLKSKTDLFTISLKPNKSLTLYDIHCNATVNSEMTITLSQLGRVLRTFSISLNKGENQIGLTSLGMLESNEPYLIECKTTNIGDVYLFPDCTNSGNHSNEVLVRYLDDHTALYGITYEIEIE